MQNSINSKNIFIAVAGRPNAGKSSLVNLLIGEKIAIVSDKPQTTRTRINGVLTTEAGLQYVFADTPGFHKAKTKLSAHMMKAVRTSLTDVDAVLLVADCTRAISQSEKDLVQDIKQNNTPAFLLLNKTDLLRDKGQLLPVIGAYSALHDFVEIIPISVKKRDNTDSILLLLEKYAKDGEHFFPDDIATDQSEKMFIAEIIREKLLRSLYEELPHGIAVVIESLEDTHTNGGQPIVDIIAAIMCEKASHKGMVIGKGGALLRLVGEDARKELEEYFECKVNLKLWVKVKEDWRNRESFISELGLNGE